MAVNEAKAYGVNWVSGWLVDNFREDINVVMVAPKGMGPSLRKKYLEDVRNTALNL